MLTGLDEHEAYGIEIWKEKLIINNNIKCLINRMLVKLQDLH